MTRLVACLVVAAGCAAPRPSGPSPSGTAADAPLATAGPRCDGGRCRCRAVDDRGRSAEQGGEGPVPAGVKRFELRVGRGFDATRVTIEGRGSVVKPAAQAEPSCAYVDLPPGRHVVRLRVEATDKVQGIHPRLLISEYGRETHDWYDTFAFSCGTAAPCIKDDMKEWMDRARAVSRGIFDPCGSARIEGLRWSVEHSPEQTLEDLTLELGLRVYRFEPRFAHGSTTCKGLSGGKAAEEELTQ